MKIELHTINLEVVDPQTSKRFYIDALGMSENAQRPHAPGFVYLESAGANRRVGAAECPSLLLLVHRDRPDQLSSHDLAGYEVPVHADIPHQEVIFLDEVDLISSPMKAKGVGELGLCGVGAAIANAIYNATGVRVRDYPITTDKLLDGLPEIV